MVVALPLFKLSAASIAYWRFEPGDPTADSSGNGHVLLLGGGTGSADHSTNAPGEGSLVFNGGIPAQTANPLDLSPYPRVTIEWFMKSTQHGSMGIVMEHSANGVGNSGGFYTILNEDGAGICSVVTAAPAWNASVEGALFDTTGGWHHYAFTLDTTLGGDDRLNIYVDGVRMADGDLAGRHWTGAEAGVALLNDVLYIGGRSGEAGLDHWLAPWMKCGFPTGF